MFDDLTDAYEAMVDWPKRLANEAPFYRGLWDSIQARSIVDAACGVGRHAAMFQSWGLTVEAADISPRMIQRARAAFGELPGLRWVVRGFDEPIQAESPLDAAICVGNSLSLAGDRQTVERAVQQMLAAVRGGGLVVVHVLNLWRLPEGPCLWQKIQLASLPQGRALIVKGVHRCGARGFVNLIVAPLSAPEQARTESTPLLGVEAADLEAAARQAGAKKVQLYGDYQSRPYQRHESVDLIMVAEKGS